MNFFKTFLASLLAFVVANVLVWMLGMIVMMGFMIGLASGGSGPVIGSGTVLKIDLAEAITDAPVVSPLGSIDFGNFRMKTSNTILQCVDAIDNAAVDDNIEGIYLNPGWGAVSLANIEELRAALLRFKESGKFIVSYNEVYTQRDYYLCSVADKIYMNPEGGIMWQGMASNVMFYKGLLDKLGVQPEVLRHGTFKAAVEPFIMDRMSPENRLQMERLTGSIWGELVGEIAASRGIDSSDLQRYASELMLRTPEIALEKGVVDSLVYMDQMISVLNELTGNDPESDEVPNLVTLSEYIGAMKPMSHKVSDNVVAIVYADGEIIDGESVDDKIGGATIAAKLARVRQDDDVKAVVLRVNSPGGSALAAEVMWREVELLRQEKPVIVSMGGTAASGGYYLSCPADIVLADKSTITGSIGVFGLLFNAEKGLREKLGITVDVVKTNPSADMGMPFRGLSQGERLYMMDQIEKVYNTFVGHVAAGRNLSVEEVDKIAEGRVWSGVDALRIGLIDGFGGLKDAILLAADRAGVGEDFRVVQELDREDSFMVLLRSLSNIRQSRMESEMGDTFRQYSYLKTMLSQQGVQARMPYIIEFE